MTSFQASTSGRQIQDVHSLNPPAGRRPILAATRGRQQHHFIDHFSAAGRYQQKQWHVVVRCQGSQSLDPPLPGLGDLSDLDPETRKTAEEFSELNKQIEEVAKEVSERLEGASIYLVGMMGSGKSTVGKLVARALEYPFLDSDEIAEAHAQSSITQIFQEEGEESFRDLESAVLQELMPFKSCVIATGGGAVTRRKNWGFMQHGIVIWLDGTPDLLARRACSESLESRPLLTPSEASTAGQEEQIEATRHKLSELLEKRKEQYAQADLTISLGDNSGNPLGAPVSVVAFRLLRSLNNRLQKDRKFEPSAEPAAPKQDFKGFGQPR